jgi:hypothetical protein
MSDESPGAAERRPREPPFPLHEDSIRAAMADAWRDHHHARDQTWHALQIEAAMAAGLLGVDVRLDQAGATLGAAMLTVMATVFGMGISLHHRKLEIRKFEHILNCERALGLHRADLISGVQLPGPVRLHDVLLIWKTNTALFILRMHFTIAAFAVLYAVFAQPGAGSFALLGITLALAVGAMVISLIRSAPDDDDDM